MTNKNLNKMRPALDAMHKKGNRAALNLRTATEYGVTEGYFGVYKTAMKNLYDKLLKYHLALHSFTTTPAELEAAKDGWVDAWKAVLQFAEKDTDRHDYAVRDDDLSTLHAYVDKLVNRDVNVTLAEDFKSAKAHTPAKEREFQKKVEFELGEYIAEANALTPTERDHNNALQKQVNKINKAQQAIADAAEQKNTLEGMLAKAKAKETKDFLTAQIAELDKKIADAKTDEKAAREALSAIQRGEEPPKPAKKKAQKDAQPKAKKEKKAPAPKAEKADAPKAKKEKKAEPVAA